MNFSVSLFKKNDLAEFQRYVKRAFHSKYILSDPKYIDWQYGGQLYVAKADKEIVGHFGFRDLAYKIYNKTQPVRVLMNFYVIESYRTTGIGALLAKKVFETENKVLVSGYTPLAQKLFARLTIFFIRKTFSHSTLFFKHS